MIIDDETLIVPGNDKHEFDEPVNTIGKRTVSLKEFLAKTNCDNCGKELIDGKCPDCNQ